MNEITHIEDVETPGRTPGPRLGHAFALASADNPEPETGQASSGAKARRIGDAGIGIGVDKPGDDQNVVADLGAELGDAGVKPVFCSDDDNDPAAEDDA